jgi:hypothetical protein
MENEDSLNKFQNKIVKLEGTTKPIVLVLFGVAIMLAYVIKNKSKS